jgi:UPF0716 protein FxsA
MARWVVLGFLALPAIEIAVFILIAAIIGVPLALALLLASSIAGLVLLRRAGTTRLERLRVAMTQSGLAGLEAAGGVFLTVLAGILLLLPGFITAALGLLLLLAPVQRWIGVRAEGFVQHKQANGAAGIVDLDHDQWSRVPPQALKGPEQPPEP